MPTVRKYLFRFLLLLKTIIDDRLLFVVGPVVRDFVHRPGIGVSTKSKTLEDVQIAMYLVHPIFDGDRLFDLLVIEASGTAPAMAHI